MKPKSTIRILLISPYFFPHIGGGQRYMEELYVHLNEQFPQFTVDVVAYNTDHAPKTENHRGLMIYRIPCIELLRGQFVLPNPIALISLLMRLTKNRYHFVHTHLRFFDSTWWAWIYARMIGARSIFTEHVASRPVHENPTVELIASMVDQTLAAWSMPHYDIVTATNRAAQQFLNRTYHLKQTIQLMYGGVDTKYFIPTALHKRVIPVIHKKLKSTDTVIAFVGRLIWAKGASKLYRVFRRLLPKMKKNVYLVIAGSGPLAKNFRKQIKLDNLEDRVWFLGPLDAKHVRAALQASDIFVHPSHHNEGFPNVILEAGAAGNYVIATDMAGVREVIIPRKTGSLIPPGDEMAITKHLSWALMHKTQARRMGKNLRKTLITNFDWRDISTSYKRVLIGNLYRKTAKPTIFSALRAQLFADIRNLYRP